MTRAPECYARRDMRRRLMLLALIAASVASGCGQAVHAPWRVRFPPDGSLACATGLELWIRSGGCERGTTEIYRATFDLAARPHVIETLPPGRYGFGARAHDSAGNWFAEGCAVVTLPRDNGTPVDLMLVRTSAPLVCAEVDGGGIDASLPADAGPARDAGPGMDGGTSPDAGPPPPDAGVDGGPGDPCAADEAGSASKVECNGPLRGPAADNEFGGHCFVGGTAGTCNDGLAFCLQLGPKSPDGTCALACPPAATYSSTGGCPSGSRCITVGPGGAYCFPDCRAHADCALDYCYPDGTC